MQGHFEKAQLNDGTRITQRLAEVGALAGLNPMFEAKAVVPGQAAESRGNVHRCALHMSEADKV